MNSVLMDFRLEEESNFDTESIEKCIVKIINHFLKLELKLEWTFSNKKIQYWTYAQQDTDYPITLSIKFFDFILITLNLDHYALNSNVVITTPIALELEHNIVKTLKGSGKCFPVLKRGLLYSPYLTTSDDRIVEYGYNRVLCSVKTEYQKIEVVETTDHGRILLLDDLVNIAENDTDSYTKTFMGDFDYNNKEILILGGGDGGLLKELLESNKGPPKFVTMIEIDELVMDTVSKYMPSICGDYLRRKEGDCYKIIVGDAFQEMKTMMENPRKFDYVFADLTDAPLATSEIESSNSAWYYVRMSLEYGLKLLKPGGKYLTHCNGKNVPTILAGFEDTIHRLGATFTKSESFVPSFMEKWVFYQIESNIT